MQEYWRDGKKVRAAKVKSMWGSADEIVWHVQNPGGYYVVDDEGESYVTAEEFEEQFRPASPDVRDAMPTYQFGGKRVKASRIKSVEPITKDFPSGEQRTVRGLLFTEHGTVEVSGAYIGWFKPEPGGYYVYDDGDFYVAALPPDDSGCNEQSNVSLKPCLYNVQFVKM